MKDLIIKLDGVDFQFIAFELLDNCPQNQSSYFIDGFLYFVQDFFNSMDTIVPMLHIGDEFYKLPLGVFLEGPLEYVSLETKHLSTLQKKEFLEGFYLGMEESCRALELAISPTDIKSVA